MALDIVKLLNRIDAVRACGLPPERHDFPTREEYATAMKVFQATLSLAALVYGAESAQARELRGLAEAVREMTVYSRQVFVDTVWPAAYGTLAAMREDVEQGIVGNIARTATGEVLADMLGLAKEALAQGDGDAKNVAAVLTAAAYEDTLRKMGAALAGVAGRPPLADVLTALKDAGVLVGASVSTAQGYLRFRNDALHADWQNLRPEVVASCLGFVEHLLLDHFA